MALMAGKLRHRVSIQTESTAVDTYGEPTASWSTDATVWASIEPTSGNEVSIGEGQAGIITHRIFMRYTANASPKKRLLFGSRVFGIVTVLNHEERNEFMQLQCKEESN
tara:strand:- start:2652 stop:2978 length:327 start_codon:yes stop_codon:yes gene_type:complete